MLKEENSIIPKQETACCGELERMVVVAFYFSTST
jgi:hypothetical protein